LVLFEACYDNQRYNLKNESDCIGCDDEFLDLYDYLSGDWATQVRLDRYGGVSFPINNSLS